MKHKMRAGALALIAALAVSACGTTSPTGSESVSAAEAAKVAAEVTTRPDAITVTEPIGKEIPSDRTIAYVQCPTPTCVPVLDSFERAADVLGWETMVIQADGTPGGLQSAFDRALQAKVDGVVWVGFDSALIPNQIKALRDAGIATVAIAVPEVETANPDVIIRGVKDADPQGRAIAAYVVANVGKDTKLTYVNLPAYPIYNAVYESFLKYYKQFCESCTVEKVDIPNTAIGKDADQRIIAALRSNKGANALFSINDGLNLGIPASLRTIGLNDVAIFGYAPSAPNFQYIEQGLERGSLAAPVHDQAWFAADAMARIFAGVSTEPSTSSLPVVVWTKENLPGFDVVPPVVEDFENQFKALWGK